MWQKQILVTVFFLTMLLSALGQGTSVTVRGQLLRNGLPVLNVPVSLNSREIGESGRVYSGGDGMFYFTNVPAGAYTLEVWSYPGRPPLTVQVTVHPPITDLPRISLP
jgi:Carboxypeptidase regulatory-like domain